MSAPLQIQPRVKKVAKKAAVKVAKPVPRAKQLRFSSVAELNEYIQGEVEKDSYRMVAKSDGPRSVDVNEKDEDSQDPIEGSWGPKPAVAHQLVKHPSTVRDKAPVTVQFVLSDVKDLAAWNALQARMHPPHSPEIRLVSYSCDFAQSIGSNIILATYSELEYQQI